MLKTKININQIAEFCINHPILCKRNKELVCKKTLQAAGYKTSKKFDNYYCNIYKELRDLVGHKSGKDYLKIDETEIYCHMCSVIFIDFLKYNNIKIKEILINVNVNRGRHSRTTVKMTRN